MDVLATEHKPALFKYQVWKNDEPIVICETLAEAERKQKEFNGDYIEWVTRR